MSRLVASMPVLFDFSGPASPRILSVASEPESVRAVVWITDVRPTGSALVQEASMDSLMNLMTPIAIALFGFVIMWVIVRAISGRKGPGDEEQKLPTDQRK